MSKLIFLDFDGIFNSESNFIRRKMNRLPTCDEHEHTFFDEIYVKYNIISAPVAEIIISS